MPLKRLDPALRDEVNRNITYSHVAVFIHDYDPDKDGEGLRGNFAALNGTTVLPHFTKEPILPGLTDIHFTKNLRQRICEIPIPIKGELVVRPVSPFSKIESSYPTIQLRRYIQELNDLAASIRLSTPAYSKCPAMLLEKMMAHRVGRQAKRFPSESASTL